ncbi:MAG: 3'-5' exonuclease [Bacteroidetes bacterium CG2_30_32_10]|nr:MAG: 3'-5' exonuclease [Bacteroidetes bacterium CG2_30_32_10]
MLKNINIQNILFLDIETVPIAANYEAMPENIKKFWNRKAEIIKKNEGDTPESIFDRAGIYAEFGKIVCISVGFIKTIDKSEVIRIKSYYRDDEKQLLQEFHDLVLKYFNKKESLLCAHNGKEFDFPYIARRMLINGIDLPSVFDFAAKKPWEIPHLDTMELWKFGDYKNYTSLDLLAAVFNIASPKDDINGAEVAGVYWKDNDLERIAKYCQKDVLTVAQLLLRYQNKPLLTEEQVVFI